MLLSLSKAFLEVFVRKFRHLLALSLMSSMILFLSAAVSTSQTPGAGSGMGAIAGTVQDSNGAILVRAKVVAEPSGRQDATDDQGQFRMAGLPSGTYTLTISYVGFSPFTTTATGSGGPTTNITASLKGGSDAD